MSILSACLYRSIQQLVDRIASSLIALSVLSLFAACASCEGYPPASKMAAQLSSFGGAERDYEFYSKVLCNCDQLAGRLSADEYELLWESAFCYRDRNGAQAIARAIPKERSPFWRACFEILAKGREDTPLSLDNVSNDDIPVKRSFVFICLFPGKDLLGKMGLGMLSGRGMTKSGTLFTVYDAFLASVHPERGRWDPERERRDGLFGEGGQGGRGRGLGGAGNGPEWVPRRHTRARVLRGCPFWEGGACLRRGPLSPGW